MSISASGLGLRVVFWFTGPRFHIPLLPPWLHIFVAKNSAAALDACLVRCRPLTDVDAIILVLEKCHQLRYMFWAGRTCSLHLEGSVVLGIVALHFTLRVIRVPAYQADCACNSQPWLTRNGPASPLGTMAGSEGSMVCRLQ